MIRMDVYEENPIKRGEYRSGREASYGRRGGHPGGRAVQGEPVRVAPGNGRVERGTDRRRPMCVPESRPGQRAVYRPEAMRYRSGAKENLRRRRKREIGRRVLAGLLLYFALAGVIATFLLIFGFFSGKREKVHAEGGQEAAGSVESIRDEEEGSAQIQTGEGDTVWEHGDSADQVSNGTLKGMGEDVTPEIRQECQNLYAGQESLLVLVNKDHELSSSYEAGLRDICYGRLQAADVLYEDLCAMLEGGREAGYEYWIASAARDRAYQQGLVDEDVENYMAKGYSYEAALEKTYEYTMPAGKSEHETGLALDILCSTNTLMDESQAGEPGNRWLAQHCHEYGFILRYPREKEDITGIQYEPWHFRYVGREAAAYLKEKGWTLEEFYGAMED